MGLTDHLRYACYAGFVRSTEGIEVVAEPPWRVAGTTQAAVWSLASLEHLFMDLRRAGARYDSALATLDLLPASAGAGTGGIPDGTTTEVA